ncbi:uncharacterized protein HD556DRAFT_1436358 [Suillus plorans]|uniref:Uncharacterized protein n=1 Tax=Suillus plorans TaxID=116603 RepID=A0A9P7J7C3_9AGAM|nr:uncharacterized protein HD556DRAFT_1436358 [Suillus plorans]KAG1806393.1 hypothetical protein HD556DRAFT_1436358 [Suillus plorans]
MSERHVHFATPVSSEAGDSLTPDAGDIWTSIMFNSNPTQDHGVVSNDSPVEPRPALQEDPIDWWGTYVPLESYEYQVDSVGKQEKNYELCFNGDFDEVTSMLSDMYVVELLHMPNFLTARHSWSMRDIGLSLAVQTSAEGCTRPEEDLVQLTTRTHTVNDDIESTLPTYHPYDCGWDDTISNPSVSPEESSPMDPYDCGWEDDINVTSQETIMPLEEILTDVRSNGANPTELSYRPSDNMPFPMDAPIINETVPLNESLTEDLYDCGWGDIVTAAAIQATDENLTANADIAAESSYSKGEMIASAAPANDPYYVGWDDPMDDSEPAEIALMADPYDCGWQDGTVLEHDIMPGDPTDDPYDCGWGPSMNVETQYPAMMEEEVANNDVDDGQMAGMVLSGAGMESRDDLYDCGWEDPMEGPTIMRLSVDRTFYVETDVINLTSESASRSVDRTFHEETDVFDLTSTSDNQSVDQTFGKETDFLDLMSTSANSERSMSPTEPNTFQEVGESMRRAIRQLNSIGHSDFNRYVRNIVAPGDGLVYDSRPGLTFMANQNLFGAYAEARDRVTNLGADIINIHRLLNIHRRIMYPLDAMITRVEQERDSML